MQRYCKNCIMPDTKPDLQFDEEGICSACRYIEKRQQVDWQQREVELMTILEQTCKRSNSAWDCVIPSSGGKDSTYQTLKALELGLRPLVVTSRTCDLTELGRKNIDALRQNGIDLIEVAPDPVIRRKLNRIGLEQVGDISWPEHLAMFTIPIRIAVQFNIPVILWGENSQNEYGGPDVASNSQMLNRRWLEEFGGLNGMRVTDVIGKSGITERDLDLYTYPDDETLVRVGITSLFLGHFFPWDGYHNALVAQAHGFNTYSTVVEGSIVNYENLDNHQNGIHDYFKFLKYGFSRTTDLACLHIRRSRLTRQQGMVLARKHDGEFPWQHLGKSLVDIIAPLDLSIDQFIEICDNFTNRKLFRTNKKGELIKDSNGSLTKLKYDNDE